MDQHVAALCRELAGCSRSEREEYYAQHDLRATVRDEIEAGLAADSDEPGRIAATVMRTEPSHVFAIGRYEVVRLLGRGGMGEVYLARDPVLERDLAVKLLAGSHDGREAHNRLVGEARAAGRLRHPNIVTIFDAGEHDGRSYIAMEYVPGETLRSLIVRREPLPLRRRLELIEGACAGLAHAHKAGVVHLDIKPDNLMLDETGVVKVLDFGIARLLKGGSHITRHLSGTLRYMSPEQVEGRPLDHRSDVFSLGCSLYELLTLVPAYDGSPQEIITRITAGPTPRLADVIRSVDARLDAVVKRCMARDPRERYDDLEELRGVLGRLRTEIDLSEHPLGDWMPPLAADYSSAPTRVSDGGRTRRPATAWENRTGVRSRLVAILGALAIAAAAAAGTVWWSGFRRATSTSTPPPSAGVDTRATPGPVGTADSVPPIEKHDDKELWVLLGRGNREGVIRILRSDPGSPQRITNVLEVVRATVLGKRVADGSTSAGEATAKYRSAEERLASSNRLAAAGQPLDALVALWRASDLYDEALAVNRSSQASAPEPPPAHAAESRPDPVSADPAAASPVPPALTPPAAAPPPLPAREAPSAGRADVPAPVPETSRPPSDETVVLEVIHRYQAAFQARDLNAVRQVFPELAQNQIEEVQRTFADMAAYQMDVRDPRVDVQGNVATVRATVARRLVPRVGRTESSAVPTEFRLRRDGSAWVITSVTVQR